MTRQPAGPVGCQGEVSEVLRRVKRQNSQKGGQVVGKQAHEQSRGGWGLKWPPGWVYARGTQGKGSCSGVWARQGRHLANGSGFPFLFKFGAPVGTRQARLLVVAAADVVGHH